MYDGLNDFLRTFSVGYPIFWALLVMAVVASTSLTLYLFWELLFRLLFAGSSLKNVHKKDQG